MMDFSDLNDEIGADDWLIPRQEITRRKLIKQTARFKIYKADWFGDVLVYEPIARQNLALRRQNQRVECANKLSCSISANQEQSFRSKLAEICSNIELQQERDQQEAPNAMGLPEIRSSLVNSRADEEDNQSNQGDSAYSSISSTPQYHTKNNFFTREFEFPSSCVSSTTSSNNHKHRQQVTKQEGALPEVTPTFNNCKSAGSNSAPVVLNKGSFVFDCLPAQEMRENGPGAIENCTELETNSSLRTCDVGLAQEAKTWGSDWFELNELRLVAHENFMLFMGASLNENDNDDEEDKNEPRGAMNSRVQQETLLVMQMSQPKSISLFNLLHANANSNSNTTTRLVCDYPSVSASNKQQLSPRDRFFNLQGYTNPVANDHLTVEAKLNICQQVTNAMTYLHDKNIVHGRLTSANIYLEVNQRVKISLLDNEERQIVCETDSAATAATACRFNLAALTYLSPELVKTIKVANKLVGMIQNVDGYHREDKLSLNHQQQVKQQQRQQRQFEIGVQMDTKQLTKKADVFSFGTLLFELFEERFPFAVKPKTPTASQISPISRATPRGDSGAGSQLASPEVRLKANTKLFETLCLESPLAANLCGRSPRAYHYNFSHSSAAALSSPILQNLKQQSDSNGNIKISASELIYQIGSGQIESRNKRAASNCPALVERIIATCWTSDARFRPTFKQLKFE